MKNLSKNHRKSERVKKLILSAIFLLVLGTAFGQPAKLPYKKGLNMLTFFEIWDPNSLPNLNKYDEDDFKCLKSMGVEVMRLPIHFDLLMEPLNTGTIKDFVLQKLDLVCDWAEKNQIYLIIDNHSFNSEEYSNNPVSTDEMKKHLEAVWTQVAPRYKNRSKYIIYEIINEPPY